MDQIKRAHDFQDQSNEQPEAAAGQDPLRQLNDLELVLCSGGEGVLTW
ncbi:MAG TPA: hypothetical protein VFD95_09465 [Usitatibacter sp.]|jgi:hypothetical protein|nr:hypothetical protein [Usitatibacter sp.]